MSLGQVASGIFLAGKRLRAIGEMTRELLGGLNREQARAVKHKKGPLLIIAGAGTGKTTVITRRIAHLIISKKAKPEEILALTFTDKAAQEMEERVDVLVPYGYTEVWISTFHSFGDRLLRDEALALGLNPMFQVLSRPEQIIFLKEHLFRFPLHYYLPLGDPTKYIEGIIALISRARDEDITPEEYLAYVEKLKRDLEKNQGGQAIDRESRKEEMEREKEVALTYEMYQGLKAKYGKIDFGDQICLSLKLFRERPAILKKYQERFKYILVDEFQDTNYAQFQLVKLLGERHKNITVTGDDDQAVYKFRGAAISNILNFMEVYPQAEQIVLTRNYRSGQILLDTAYELIKNNNPDRLEIKNLIDKRLRAERKEGGNPPEHLHYDTLSTESDEVAKLIEEKVTSGKYSYKDLAVLVRSNNDADPFLRAMNMKNIPYRFSGNQGLYKREEVRLLISFLRAIAKFDDSASLYHLASSSIYELPVLDLTKMMGYARRKNRSLQEVLLGFEKIAELEGISRKKVKKLKEDFENYLGASIKLPSGQLLHKFFKESGYLAQILESDSPSTEEEVQNISKFFKILENFGKIAQLDRAPQFVEYLDMLVEAGDDPAVVEVVLGIDAVNVLTVHKAKGLEFPVVIMVSLVSQRFPVRGRKEPIELPLDLVKDILPSGDFHLQEERRLFYVGMTRAKKELYLTSARDYGGKRSRKVSPFLCEALGMSPEKEPYKVSALEAIARNAPGEVAEGKVAFLPEGKTPSLSYRRLDDYITCPWKYRYIHILRVPIMRYPPVIYGYAIHNAIQEYFKNKKNGHKVTPEVLFGVFESSWVNEGFLSREHEERRFKAGKETLRRFFQAEEKIGRIPSKVEEPFNFPLGDTRIKGRWDLIEIEDGKETIIDFKTSQVKDQKEADKKTRDSLQLSVYALAYLKDEQRKKIPDSVELHFVESGLVGQAKKSEGELKETVVKIEEAAKGICSRHYGAKPDYFSCRWCPYQGICPYRSKR